MLNDCCDHASDVAVELPAVLARLNRWATRRAGGRMPTAQARLLAIIDECAPARTGDLARADHCSQPAMTRQIRHLESNGLIARDTDPRDARASLISLTTLGQEKLADIRAARQVAIASALEGLSAADRRRIATALPALERLAVSTRAERTKPLETDD